jgi:hypothetical protein
MGEKTRYSDAELEEFKAIILEKLAKAQKEYDDLRSVVSNADGNDVITLKELQAYGLHKNRELATYFNGQTSGALFATNPQKKNDGSVKSNFSTNFTGGLSPKVNSDVGPSPLGNLLPYLYA